MTVQIDNQLVQVYYNEALQNAARARAERSSRPVRRRLNVRETLVALATAGVPVLIWLILFLRAK